MNMDPLMTVSRNERRTLLRAEAKARASGQWGAWEVLHFPADSIGSGWTREITTAYRNAVFSVLWRRLPNGVIHLAVTSLSHQRPSWPEMQRIKDEIAGEHATAVEVYPPHDEIVDAADMYHLWVVPALDFGLHIRNSAVKPVAQALPTLSSQPGASEPCPAVKSAKSANCEM